MKSFKYLFVLVIALTITVVSCKKETIKVVPNITTSDLSEITSSSATSGGEIPSDGGSAVTARGVCWSKSQNPTIADNKTSDGTGSGSFMSTITGLTSGTTYYVKAYATNSIGTAYGNQVTTTTTSKRVLLTSKQWKFLSSKTNGVADVIDNCEKDDFVIFASNGTYTWNPTTVKCDPSDAIQTGNWTLSGDEKTLSLDGDEATIVELTESRLVVSTIDGSDIWEQTFIAF